MIVSDSDHVLVFASQYAQALLPANLFRSLSDRLLHPSQDFKMLLNCYAALSWRQLLLNTNSDVQKALWLAKADTHALWCLSPLGPSNVQNAGLFFGKRSLTSQWRATFKPDDKITLNTDHYIFLWETWINVLLREIDSYHVTQRIVKWIEHFIHYTERLQHSIIATRCNYSALCF